MSDETPFANLTPRQEKLLEILIREFITQPEPLSSKALASLSDLGLSSATVRNEMAILEEAGYLRAPHTSAGRVPTEEGYRYFVRRLLADPEVYRANETSIQAHFQEMPPDMEAWLQNAAEVLARQTRTAALVTEPRAYASNRFKQVQLVAVQGRLVLMVLVLDGGNIHQQLLIMAEPVPQDRLNQATEAINRVCLDLPGDQIRERTRALPSVLAQEIGALIGDAFHQLREGGNRVIYRAGLGNIVMDIEEEGIQQAIQVLEGHVELDEIINELSTRQQGPIHVIVGGNGRWEEFNSISMVLGRYGNHHVMGTMAVVGPTRMRYQLAIATVNYISELISGFLTDAGSQAQMENDA